MIRKKLESLVIDYMEEVGQTLDGEKYDKVFDFFDTQEVEDMEESKLIEGIALMSRLLGRN